jgi:precorrin-6B C5,15-methyltransferase / cobalt-precorrin-6B C5,C15-methyltransferase
MTRIFVIGIGYRPLDKRAKEIVAGSKAIFASDRLLEVFSRYDEYEASSDRLKIMNSAGETFDAIRTQLMDNEGSVITLLASGDPMFFGIGRRVIEEFGKEIAEIIPDLSSVQVAFARICEPWDNVFFVSMHGGPDKNIRRKLEYELADLPALLNEHNRLAVLTDDINNPSVIAREFARAGNPDVIFHVCERLGYPDEKITTGAPSEIEGKTFREPNVVVIKLDASSGHEYMTGNVRDMMNNRLSARQIRSLASDRQRNRNIMFLPSDQRLNDLRRAFDTAAHHVHVGWARFSSRKSCNYREHNPGHEETIWTAT